jgi:ribonuclease D
MRTLGRSRSLAALVGLGLVVAGCGSSSSSTSSTAAAPALTKAEYVKQGNAICKASKAERQAAFTAYAKAHHLNNNSAPTNAQAAQLATTVLIPSIQATISAIKALVPPNSDQAQVTAMLAASHQDLDRAKQDPAQMVTSGGQFAHSGKLLHAYGLTSCATNTG